MCKHLISLKPTENSYVPRLAKLYDVSKANQNYLRTFNIFKDSEVNTVGTVPVPTVPVKNKPKGLPVAMLRRLVAFAAWGVGGRAGSSPRPRFASMCIAAPSLAPKEREALARRCALHACSLSLTTAPRDPPLVLVSGLAAHQVGFFCGEQ